MKSRFCLLLFVGLAIGLGWQLPWTNRAKGQPPQASKEVSTSGEEPLNVRYARTYLALAKIDLEKAMNANKSVAGTLSATYLEPLRQAITMAEQQLDEAVQEASGKKLVIHMRSEELTARLAEATYQKALATNARFNGTISEFELERLRLTAEVAKLNLARAKVASQTELGYVQWQVDQLRDEVFRLRNTVAQLSRMN